MSDELLEVLCLFIEHEFPSDSLRDVEKLFQNDENNADNDQVKEGELNNQEEDVYHDNHEEQLDEEVEHGKETWHLSLLGLQLDVGLQLLNSLLVGFVQGLPVVDQLHSNLVVGV